MSYNNSILIIGTHTLQFESFTEFRQWKEHEEENTYTTSRRSRGCDGCKCIRQDFPPKKGVQNFKKNLWLWLPTAYAYINHEVLRVDLHADVYVILLDCTWSQNRKCSVTAVASRAYSPYNVCTQSVGRRCLQRS